MKKKKNVRTKHIAVLSLIMVLILFLLSAGEVNASSAGRDPGSLQVGDRIRKGDVFTSPDPHNLWQFFYKGPGNLTTGPADIGSEYEVKGYYNTDEWVVTRIEVTTVYQWIELKAYEEPAREPGPEPEPEEEEPCRHEYEWEVEKEATATNSGLMCYRCVKCNDVGQTLETSGYAPFLQDTIRVIEGAEQGSTVTVEAGLWVSFEQSVIDALLKRPDVTLVINYRYKGKYYTTGIPAGADLSGLVNGDGYCGFRYIDKIFGGSEL